MYVLTAHEDRFTVLTRPWTPGDGWTAPRPDREEDWKDEYDLVHAPGAVLVTGPGGTTVTGTG